MSLSFNSLFLMAGVLLPLLAFWRAARQRDVPTGKLVAAPIAAGAVVSASFLALAFLRDVNRVHELALYPYAVGFSLWGLLVGAVGALVRRDSGDMRRGGGK